MPCYYFVGLCVVRVSSLGEGENQELQSDGIQTQGEIYNSFL